MNGWTNNNEMAIETAPLLGGALARAVLHVADLGPESTRCIAVKMIFLSVLLVGMGLSVEVLTSPKSATQSVAYNAFEADFRELSKDMSSISDFLTHQVRYENESLSLISAWYTGNPSDWDEIAKANPDMNPKVINRGQEIRIPRKMVVRAAPLPKMVAESRIAPVKVVEALLKDPSRVQERAT